MRELAPAPRRREGRPLATASDRYWVKDLKPGTELDELFVVRSKDLRQRRGGGPYLALTLGDRTGEVTGLVWENVDRLGKLCEVGQVLRFRGQVQRYNQRLQVVVRGAEPAPVDEVDQALFVRSSEIDPDVLWQRLIALVEEVSDPHLKQLLFRVFSDPEVAQRLKVAPAARGMHHAFRSGLLEHTVSMAASARALARHYRLHEDMVVTGALLHDLGKIWELEIDASIEYTDDGRLLGHLAMEVLYVERIIAELSSFPGEHRRHLLHILLSHHGEYEYGSPRRPKTPEALLVHMADNLDSKMAGMLEAIGTGGDDEDAWSEYSRILDRYVYRRRLPASDNSATNS
jgi:3'-5' exoribonuclease